MFLLKSFLKGNFFASNPSFPLTLFLEEIPLRFEKCSGRFCPAMVCPVNRLKDTFIPLR